MGVSRREARAWSAGGAGEPLSAGSEPATVGGATGGLSFPCVVLCGAGELVGLGEFFENNWDELVVGTVSVVGFTLGGPPLAIVLGAVAGGITSAAQNEDPINGAAYAAVGGLFGGAASFGVKGILGVGGSVLARNLGWRGALPRALNGGQVAAWKTYAGLLGAATTGWTADSAVRATVYEHLGYPAIPLIDISAEELSDIPESMPHVYMPDPGKLPEGLEFTGPMQRNFRTLPSLAFDSWITFGEKPTEEQELPEEMDVTEIFGEERAGIPDYAHRVELLRDRYATIRGRSVIVAEAVKRSSSLCRGGRYDQAASIIVQNKYAGTDPRDAKNLTALLAEHNEKLSDASGIPVFFVDPQRLSEGMQSEDAYTFVLLESGYANVETLMSYYAGQFEELAAKVQAEGAKDKDSASKEEDRSADSGDDPVFDPAAARQAEEEAERPGTTGPGRVPAPEPWDLSAGADSTGDGDSSAATETDSGPASSAPGAGGSEPAGPAIDARPSPMPVAATSAGMGPALQAMLLPQLMRGALGNRRNDPEGRPRAQDREPEDDTSVTALRPGTVAAPSPGQPATGQNAGAPAAPAGPAKAVSPPADSSPPPGRVTGRVESGSVVYTFPDGRTQEVSVVVAHGLDRAFGNAAGTDAQAAYAGTAAEWSDPKRIGVRVDPAQLTTGDVGLWDNRIALLVVFPAESAAEATVEVVADGALQPVSSLAEMRDAEGEFGAFGGFFHPPGIEPTARGAADGPPAAEQGTDVAVPA